MAGLRIREPGRRVGRGERIQGTGGGVHQHGDFRARWAGRERSLVRAREAERDEEGEDVGFCFDDRDGPQQAGAQWAAQRVGTPDLLDQVAPGAAGALGARGRAEYFTFWRRFLALTQPAGLRDSVRNKRSNLLGLESRSGVAGSVTYRR